MRCINTGPNHALNMGCSVSAVDGGNGSFTLTNNGCYLNGANLVTLPASSVGPNEYVECRLSYTQPNASITADYTNNKQVSVMVSTVSSSGGVNAASGSMVVNTV